MSSRRTKMLASSYTQQQDAHLQNCHANVVCGLRPSVCKARGTVHSPQVINMLTHCSQTAPCGKMHCLRSSCLQAAYFPHATQQKLCARCPCVRRTRGNRAQTVSDQYAHSLFAGGPNSENAMRETKCLQAEHFPHVPYQKLYMPAATLTTARS